MISFVYLFSFNRKTYRNICLFYKEFAFSSKFLLYRIYKMNSNQFEAIFDKYSINRNLKLEFCSITNKFLIIPPRRNIRKSINPSFNKKMFLKKWIFWALKMFRSPFGKSECSYRVDRWMNNGNKDIKNHWKKQQKMWMKMFLLVNPFDFVCK